MQTDSKISVPSEGGKRSCVQVNERICLESLARMQLQRIPNGQGRSQ
jgi:hypothetical protein